MRAFASELGVSHAAVETWENGTREPEPERIAAWVNDPRDWVSRLGRQLFEARFGVRVSRLPSQTAPGAEPDSTPEVIS